MIFRSLWEIHAGLDFDCKIKHSEAHSSTVTTFGLHRKEEKFTEKLCASSDGIISATIANRTVQAKALFNVKDYGFGFKVGFGNSK